MPNMKPGCRIDTNKQDIIKHNCSLACSLLQESGLALNQTNLKAKMMALSKENRFMQFVCIKSVTFPLASCCDTVIKSFILITLSISSVGQSTDSSPKNRWSRLVQCEFCLFFCLYFCKHTHTHSRIAGTHISSEGSKLDTMCMSFPFSLCHFMPSP